MNFSTWSISDYAAWWGAVTATVGLVWHIITGLRSGPRIHVRANVNMQIFPKDPSTQNKRYISVTAVNRGNATTTITQFSGFHLNSFWKCRKKQRQLFVIPTHRKLGEIVPHVLAPGEEWSNRANQSWIEEEFGSGYLYIGVSHNQSNRPVYARLRINANKDEKV